MSCLVLSGGADFALTYWYPFVAVVRLALTLSCHRRDAGGGIPSLWITGDGGERGSVVMSASEFKSEDPGFDPIPWRGRVKRQFLSVSPSELLCRLVCA